MFQAECEQSGSIDHEDQLITCLLILIIVANLTQRLKTSAGNST